MEVCDTCKHWILPNASIGAVWGRCKDIIKHHSVDIYFESNNEAFEYISGEIVVDTLPDFGCVSWEKLS